MTSESIQVVKSIFENPLSFMKLGNPQVYDNMTLIPIIIQDDRFIDFITIKEAEESGVIEIVESETVSQLEVINKSDKQILIPFGMTVHGGKQDRTIWEPILLPVGGKQNIIKGEVNEKYVIPAKCVEQSRWSYKKGKGFKSSNTRLHPNVAYEAISAAGQGNVWDEIQSHRVEMNYAANIAPSQSYLDMTKVSEKDTEEITSNFSNVKDQCGIAVFVNEEFIGIEFYANKDAWKSMSQDIYKAFAIEALRFKKDNKEKADIEHHFELLEKFRSLKLKFTDRQGVGLGQVIEFHSDDNKWRGITLAHQGTMAQFYLVSKRGGVKNRPEQNIQFQTNISQRFEI